MILSSIMNLLKNLLFFCFSFINLPSIPTDIIESINSFLNLIFDNLTLLGFFIRPTTLKIVIPILIIVLNFDKIYHLVIWILKKIPFFSIK